MKGSSVFSCPQESALLTKAVLTDRARAEKEDRYH